MAEDEAKKADDAPLSDLKRKADAPPDASIEARKETLAASLTS